ncbi:MAG: response regulator [Elusimicrobia bacterium]|nr:response regulator [Elusimicrobiota bacterium]
MTSPAAKKVRILVADDEPDLLQIMKETLEREGFEVETAEDGSRALQAIHSRAPDIAVLDLRMPRLDGFQVCQKLREDPLFEHLPVIILSATGTRDSKVTGLNLGADDFITKPVDVPELLARIRMIIRRNRQDLDASPLTRLPGNVSIETHIEQKLSSGEPIAVLYIDLNQFKAYNDAYGYDAGDRVLRATGELLIKITHEAPNAGDFVGHIGGDDFIVITAPERMERLAKRVIEGFDKLVPEFHNETDRKQGKIVSTDRQGRIREFPLLSVAIGICHSGHRKLESYGEISQLGTELKKAAKTKKGSAYVLDRRR